MINQWAIILVLAMMLATVATSFYSRRFTRTTVEFYLAGRRVGFFLNASAICGDYFSAASFLGVAAAVYASGLDGVWFGTGFGAAFVPVLLFIASPLRRFGEYTIPDFLASRFQSPLARVIGIIMVQVICIFYLAPQMVGAGATWTVLVQKGFLGLSPYATGVLVTVMVMMFYVGMGGMRGTTWNQMIQFWILLVVMLTVVVLGLRAGFSYPRHLAAVSSRVLVAPAKLTAAELSAPNPLTGRTYLEEAREVMSEGAFARVEEAAREGRPDKKVWVLLPQRNKLHPWRPMRFVEPGHRYGWLDQFSMVLALVMGTMGLPHIMNRYYTNPTGKFARWTTVWVLIFAAIFYILAGTAGLIGRALIPGLVSLSGGEGGDLVVDGVLRASDTLMPVLGKLLGGELGLGIVAVGAFAAMFSSIGGLLMALAVSWGHDFYEKFVNPGAPERRKVAVGKLAVVIMSVLSAGIGLGIPYLGLAKAYPSLIAMMVTWAFAVSGGAFVPTFIASLWWKRTTLKGAVAGMLVGGAGTVLFIILNILRETNLVSPASLPGKLGTLTYPTVFTLPIALLSIVLVSLWDRNLPRNVDEIWVRIHGTARERRERRLQEVSLYQGSINLAD